LKVIIACGGTGGHLYPGLALGEELFSGYSAEVVYAVGKNDRSVGILKSKNFRIAEFPSAPFPRGWWQIVTGSGFKFLYRNLSGLLTAISFIRSFRPDVVVGMGAYVSFPVILAAKIFRIPVLIHEQNSVPGLANRFLSLFADRIAVSFPSATSYFNAKKVIQAGNPVRREIALNAGAIRRKNPSRFGLAENKFTILVMGGSQGASGINRSVANREFLRKVLEMCSPDIQFIHITGERDCEIVKQIYKSLGVRAAVYPYLSDEMSEAYGSSDMAICRAGATTIAELSVVGIPAVFIPYPHATDDHQTKNAAAYISGGNRGMIISENEISDEKLASAVAAFYKEYLADSKIPKDKTTTSPSSRSPLPQEMLAGEIARLSGLKPV